MFRLLNLRNKNQSDLTISMRYHEAEKWGKVILAQFGQHWLPFGSALHFYGKSSWFILCWYFVYKFSLRPDIVLSNGPGTGLPMCVIARIMDLLQISPIRVVYAESICRVNRLSLTGTMLYYTRMAHSIIVQWPELRNIYPRTKYMGRLVWGIFNIVLWCIGFVYLLYINLWVYIYKNNNKTLFKSDYEYLVRKNLIDITYAEIYSACGIFCFLFMMLLLFLCYRLLSLVTKLA